MENRYNILKNKFEKFCYTRDYNNFGNICINVVDIKIKDVKGIFNQFLEYLEYAITEAKNISEKYRNNQVCAHLYLDGATMKNFSLTLFKKIVAVLQSAHNNLLNTCYIYNKNPAINKLINTMKCFVEKDIRKKILIINQ
jgi:hypothetical protein